MSTQQLASTNSLQERSLEDKTGQYTLWQMLGIWAVVTLPMVLLNWVIPPILIPISPFHPGITYWLSIITGMAWQFVVSLVILYRELGTLRWSAIRPRIWLQTPRDPKTDQPNKRLYWWVLPLIIIDYLIIFALGRYLDAPMGWLFPAFQAAPYMEMSGLATPEFRGQWWLLGVALLSFIFNYVLGEGLLWHGVLLPKMRGVFGKSDWIANAVLFGLYHMHKPWELPSVIVSNLTYSWPVSRFRSNWMSLIVHGAELFPVLFVVLGVILGLIG